MKSISRNVQHLRSWMTKGCTIPPVAPEVINILLFQRSEQVIDAPSEHIYARQLSAEGLFANQYRPALSELTLIADQYLST